ncbi:LVIVD repeat-containing protein [Conexibacter sp. CPCC 206217]|uniref:LVIVD repeat-containing protein n=1 Tax=Conexibacter sp. CPCC 206217 TaxID=3064574 RepID=UPI002727D3E2|nr:hypothetical protein [Conexibacter sp. CPCC 206217]MDO8212382.1 hypothetical protein [Conexibacter sp. CPCC 206217]
MSATAGTATDAFTDNVEFVGYDDLDGRSGFKLALHEANGRFYLYVAALWHSGWSIVDVTDPRAPRFVRWIPGPPNTWTIQVQVADGKMVTSLEHMPPAWGGQPDPAPQEGILIWDLADPEDPQLLGHWRGGARGTHRNFYAGGRYVHATTTLPGFHGHLYGIVDMEDPSEPQLVGRWWWPGQHVAGGEQLSAHDAAKGREFGRVPAISLHGAPYVEGNRAYAPWMRAGLVILDVEDVTVPKLVGSLSMSPPFGSRIAMHSAIPLPGRDLVVINSEAMKERCEEPLNYAGIVDVSDETDPVLISLFPVPDVPEGYGHETFADKGGRFGPHNQHQPQGQPVLERIGDLIYLTYFNAGLQVYDISRPIAPKLVGHYIPGDPAERRGLLPTELVTQVEDVVVDRRGYVYLSEKNSGVTIVRYTGND